MTTEFKLNNNIRSKLRRREAWEQHRKDGCSCGGFKRYELHKCFRPGGNACKRRRGRQLDG